MIKKVNPINFKGTLITKAFKINEPIGTMNTKVFDTDLIRDIQKHSASGDTILVYNSPKEKCQIGYIIPREVADTNEIINAYTAGCQNKYIAIALDYKN